MNPLLILPLLLAAPPATEAPLSSLVRAETAFAALSEREGTRAAFLAVLRADSLLFRPGPVSGRGAWETRAEDPGLLTWYPAFAEISSDGDWGYTTGPAQYRADRTRPGDAPVYRGRFASVWRREADGTWRLFLDGAAPGLPGDDALPRLGPHDSPRPASPVGIDAAREKALLAQDGPSLPQDRDLGFVYGTRLGGPAGPGAKGAAFLHIWRKEGGTWRLRVAAEYPMP